MYSSERRWFAYSDHADASRKGRDMLRKLLTLCALLATGLVYAQGNYPTRSA